MYDDYPFVITYYGYHFVGYKYISNQIKGNTSKNITTEIVVYGSVIALVPVLQ